jgi:feruloyl esterase
MMRRLHRCCVLVTALAATAVAASAVAAPAVAMMATDCTALGHASVAKEAIGLPSGGAVVSSAQQLDDPATGPYCELLGAIKPIDPAAPDIQFRVNLPPAWNGKAVQMGGGGFDGRVPPATNSMFADPAAPTTLRRGYATFSSDSGHAVQPGTEAAAFALNAEALANFAGEQLKKTHDVAVALIRLAYGQAPHRMYFQGNSQGGHEALTVVQRYPADYDGAVAIHPVYDLTGLHLDGVLLGQALYNSPGAWVSPAKVALVSAKVLERCDALDGLRDGIIGNVKACERRFDLAALRCADGTDRGADCLSDAQIASFRTFAQPMPLHVTLEGSLDTFAGWPILEGGTMAGAFFTPFGASAQRPTPGSAGAAFAYMMGDQTLRYLLLHDARADTLSFEPAQHAAALQALSRQLDASNPDLSVFEHRGGKLLLMHGTVDMAVPPQNTVRYYQQLQSRFGRGLSRFVRFYVAPGFGHGDGAFVVGWDSLDTLDAWVDRGIVPGPQVATDTNKATAGRTRPLCEFPRYPRYNGSGDVTASTSFRCARP